MRDKLKELLNQWYETYDRWDRWSTDGIVSIEERDRYKGKASGILFAIEQVEELLNDSESLDVE